MVSFKFGRALLCALLSLTLAASCGPSECPEGDVCQTDGGDPNKPGSEAWCAAQGNLPDICAQYRPLVKYGTVILHGPPEAELRYVATPCETTSQVGVAPVQYSCEAKVGGRIATSFSPLPTATATSKMVGVRKEVAGPQAEGETVEVRWNEGEYGICVAGSCTDKPQRVYNAGTYQHPDLGPVPQTFTVQVFLQGEGTGADLDKYRIRIRGDKSWVYSCLSETRQGLTVLTGYSFGTEAEGCWGTVSHDGLTLDFRVKYTEDGGGVKHYVAQLQE